MSELPLVSYVIATAGHVDHGKSSLVKALTGTDPDRLPEEKRRGVTIDLGFAHFQLPSPSGLEPQQSASYSVSIIDVPGHEHFVKNMVAGVGSIDAALLVVGADDGWMPQTEEHVQILSHLGVHRAAVALTKIDLATKERAMIDSVRQHLRNTPFALSPIVPTSTIDGRGMDALKQELAMLFAGTPSQRDIGKPRLPIDRVFSLKGIGTVVTGTLTGGQLRQGQSVCVQPRNFAARIRSIQTHNRDVVFGTPGSRIALNLPDVYPADGASGGAPNSIARGDVVTLAECGTATCLFDAILERLGDGGSGRPIGHNLTVRIHHGSCATAARLDLLEGKQLDAPGRALARLVLQTPIFAFVGDRFVVRDWPEHRTLGGGIVLDVHPPAGRMQRPKPGSPGWKCLQMRASAPRDADAFLRSGLERDGILPRATILQQSRFGPDEIETSIADAITAGVAVDAGGLLADSAAWFAALRRAVSGIDVHHQKHPEQPGLPLSDLRTALVPLAPKVVDALTESMCRDGFVSDGTAIRRRSHAIALPPRLQLAGERLRKQLAEHPFDPPSRKELCHDDPSHQALKFLLATGEVVAINPDLVLSARAYGEAADKIRDYLIARESATVSELKMLLGSSRRVMVPLLEKLDRDKLTSRQGDRRVLNQTLRSAGRGET
jgi:selenocysteine-specific elongation factor